MSTIAEEIKQTNPFRTPNEKSFINIIYTNNWLYMKHNKFFKRHGISIQQYNVLRILNGQDNKSLTINNIISRMLDKMSNASRLVDKLYLRGLVTRVENKADRRACDVAITSEGRKVLKTMNDEIMTIQNEISNLNEEEAEQLSNLLDKLRSKTVD